MDKEIVIVVPNETAAYEVVKALKGLDDEGSIELYASTVVVKSPDGTLTVKDAHGLRPPWAAAVGMATGALIGLLAGPVGVAAGAAVGGAAGLGGDLTYSGFAGEFVYGVAAKLQPGSYAVFASVWEDWTVPIDTAAAPYGGVVFRQATDDVVTAQIKADWQATKDDAAHLEAEITKAAGDTKTKLQAKRDELRKKEAAQRERLLKRVQRLQESWDAKIASAKSKAEAGKAEAKARHEHHAQKLSRFAATQKQAFHDLLV
ncbi:MAG TPA: DUF1269 domain-containing protein [Polyangiaceae bacterium]|nr:DUF1269 domain-containing protein [Polyangiaceae bacterium]